MKRMKKILIVDDDFIVREGLVKTVDWSSVNCKVTGVASNGREALMKIEEEMPDIIITDICMREMDGLELLQNLKLGGISAKIIILSGFNDFEYAKSAMELGVKHYLLKPIENKKLLETVKSACDEIDNDMKKSGFAETVKHQIILRGLLEGNSIQNFKDFGIVVPTESFVVISIKIMDEREREENLVNTTMLLESVEFCLGMDTHFTIPVLVGKDVVLIYFAKEGKFGEDKLLKRIKEHFALKSKFKLVFGISSTGDDLGQLRELYQQSLMALDNIKGNVPQEIQSYGKIKTDTQAIRPFLMTHDGKEKFIKALVDGETAGVHKILNQFFEQIKADPRVTLKNAQDTFIDISVKILRENIYNVGEMLITFGRKIQPASEIIQNETISDLEDWIVEFSEKMLSHKKFVNVSQYDYQVKEIVLYIMRNFSSKLSVDFLAKQFFISEGHLMRIFKKETGMTVIEFIMEYRVYIAKELLCFRKYRINEISNMVGYSDTKYFSKVFKTVVGCSPNVYKK